MGLFITVKVILNFSNRSVFLELKIDRGIEITYWNNFFLTETKNSTKMRCSQVMAKYLYNPHLHGLSVICTAPVHSLIPTAPVHSLIRTRMVFL